MAYDVKARKRKLITENINRNPKAEAGRRQVAAFFLITVLSRLALTAYKLIYISSLEIGVGKAADILLFLGLAAVLYMVTDGNRGLAWVTAISAVVWGIYCFTSLYPLLADKPGAVAFVAIFITVMAVQFILSVIMATLPMYDTYFSQMMKINLTIRREMITGGRK